MCLVVRRYVATDECKHMHGAIPALVSICSSMCAFFRNRGRSKGNHCLPARWHDGVRSLDPGSQPPHCVVVLRTARGRGVHAVTDSAKGKKSHFLCSTQN
jgi:hypothetical protein